MNSRVLSALGLLTALVLLGCVSIPDSPSPLEGIDAPQEFVAAERTDPEATLDRWWEAFDDAELTTLIERGLDNNLDLAIAATRVEATLAQARIAGAALRPQLQASLASRRTKQNFIGLPIPGAENQVLSTTATTHNLALNASWEPDLWGRLRAGKRAALSDAAAVEYDLAAARTALAGQFAKLTFGLREARLQVALDQQTLDSRRETVERIERRYERGLASPLDIRLASAQVANIEASLAANRQRVASLERQLQTLSGVYPDGELRQVGATTGPLPSVVGEVPVGLPSDLLRRRPDLRAAEERAAAAAERVGEARAALYPSFSLTASGGTSSRDLQDLLDSDFSVWSLASNLLQPILSGGRLRAAVDASETLHRQTLLQWLQLALNAFAEVETQLIAEQTSAARLEALERSLVETREAERLAIDRYLAGLATYLDLLESQRQAFVAESTVLAARRQRLDTRIDLLLALGGGFVDPRTASASPTTNPEGAAGAER